MGEQLGEMAVMNERPANDDRSATGRRSISDDDLSAYVAGGLSPARRVELEGFLACNPDVAAQVMTELHRRGPARPRRAGARRWASLAAMAAVALLAAVGGWNVARIDGPDDWVEKVVAVSPAYVEDALESQQATKVRAAMLSQAETPVLDRAEIQRSLRVRAPILPSGWRLLDAQVFPSDDGPGLNLIVEAPNGRRLSLFAVSADTWVTANPVVARKGRETVAFWETGGSAFVLIGDNSGGELLKEARLLARQT